MDKWKCPSCDSEELPIYLEVVESHNSYPILESDGIYIRGEGLEDFDTDNHPLETYIACRSCGEMYIYGFIVYADEEINMNDIEL